MRLRADAEHEDVELRDLAVVFGLGRGLQPGGVPGRRGLRIVAVRPVRSGHRVHPGRIDVHVVQQRRASSGIVPLRVAGRRKPLVAPPDVQVPPVDRVPGRGGGQLGQHRGADAAPGQHHRGGPCRGHRIDQPGDQARGDRLGQQLRISVDDDLGHAHEALMKRFMTNPWPARGVSRRRPRPARACATPRRPGRRCHDGAAPPGVLAGRARTGWPSGRRAWRS